MRALALGCFYSHISTRTFPRALTASLDSCAEIKSTPSVLLCRDKRPSDETINRRRVTHSVSWVCFLAAAAAAAVVVVVVVVAAVGVVVAAAVVVVVVVVVAVVVVVFVVVVVVVVDVVVVVAAAVGVVAAAAAAAAVVDVVVVVVDVVVVALHQFKRKVTKSQVKEAESQLWTQRSQQ